MEKKLFHLINIFINFSSTFSAWTNSLPKAPTPSLSSPARVQSSKTTLPWRRAVPWTVPWLSSLPLETRCASPSTTSTGRLSRRMWRSSQCRLLSLLLLWWLWLLIYSYCGLYDYTYYMLYCGMNIYFNINYCLSQFNDYGVSRDVRAMRAEKRAFSINQTTGAGNPLQIVGHTKISYGCRIIVLRSVLKVC